MTIELQSFIHHPHLVFEPAPTRGTLPTKKRGYHSLKETYGAEILLSFIVEHPNNQKNIKVEFRVTSLAFKLEGIIVKIF